MALVEDRRARLIRRFTCGAAVCVAVAGCALDFGEVLPKRLQRGPPAASTFVVSGSSATGNFVRVWAAAYQRQHPDASVRVEVTSSSAAPQAMVRNATTIGMMSRPMNSTERDAVTKAHGRPPLELRVAIDAVGIFVFKDNPLPAISIEQIGRIFSASADGANTWADLGLEGDWGRRPIVAFGFDSGRGAYEVMRELVLRGGNFRRSIITEPVSSSVVQGVGMEPGGVGYASVFFRTMRTRVLPISTPEGVVTPTDDIVAAGNYPLARYLYLYVVPPGSAPIREFLRLVLSPEGQDMAKGAGAFKIARELANAQLATLER